MSRFDYVPYDLEANAHQAVFKAAAIDLETKIETLRPGRAKALAITRLEETYMWIGKAVRDEQLQRELVAASGVSP